MITYRILGKRVSEEDAKNKKCALSSLQQIVNDIKLHHNAVILYRDETTLVVVFLDRSTTIMYGIEPPMTVHYEEKL